MLKSQGKRLATGGASAKYLCQQIHLLSDNCHVGLYLLPVSRDQLIFFVLQLLIQLVALALQLLLFCIAGVIQVVLGDVAVSASGAPDWRPGPPVPVFAPAMNEVVREWVKEGCGGVCVWEGRGWEGGGGGGLDCLFLFAPAWLWH